MHVRYGHPYLLNVIIGGARVHALKRSKATERRAERIYGKP